MLPPVGTIIVGPCPECQGLVVVFCGNVLALDKDIMLSGGLQEKRDHLMTVLTQFLRERITQMVTDEPADQEQPTTEEPESEGTSHAPPARASKSTAEATLPRTPISKDEFSAFTNVELKLLDNSNYFKAIFG